MPYLNDDDFGKIRRSLFIVSILMITITNVATSDKNLVDFAAGITIKPDQALTGLSFALLYFVIRMVAGPAQYLTLQRLSKVKDKLSAEWDRMFRMEDDNFEHENGDYSQEIIEDQMDRVEKWKTFVPKCFEVTFAYIVPLALAFYCIIRFDVLYRIFRALFY